MGSDKAMMIVLLYIVIVIMAFVFGITISNTIRKEAGVIGTLRASGYTKGKLIRHYMTLPVIITLFGALIGNILGYTVMKNVCASMYYGSYSLPWNFSPFSLTGNFSEYEQLSCFVYRNHFCQPAFIFWITITLCP